MWITPLFISTFSHGRGIAVKTDWRQNITWHLLTHTMYALLRGAVKILVIYTDKIVDYGGTIASLLIQPLILPAIDRLLTVLCKQDRDLKTRSPCGGSKRDFDCFSKPFYYYPAWPSSLPAFCCMPWFYDTSAKHTVIFLHPFWKAHVS